MEILNVDSSGSISRDNIRQVQIITEIDAGSEVEGGYHQNIWRKDIRRQSHQIAQLKENQNGGCPSDTIAQPRRLEDCSRKKCHYRVIAICSEPKETVQISAVREQTVVGTRLQPHALRKILLRSEEQERRTISIWSSLPAGYRQIHQSILHL